MPFNRGVRSLADLRAGDHVCCLYESEEEHRAVAVPFVRQGLERGEKVLYIADAHPADAILGLLRAGGVEVDPSLGREQLRILSAAETYTRDECFDPDRMISRLQAETAQALTEGYPALRVTGEMSWALGGLRDCERLVEYEAKLNRFFPGSACLGLCQYDRRRFDPAVLLDVLHTHPLIFVGTHVSRNPYYIAPAAFLEHEPAARLDQWVQALAEAQSVDALEILDALPAHICVLDEDGKILAVNRAWRDFAAANPPLAAAVDIGADYFGVCDAVTGADAVMAREAVRGLRAVGRGEVPEFSFEYPCHSPDTQRWFLLRATRLADESRPRIVVVHINITERKQAEETLERNRAELKAVYDHAPVMMCMLDRDRRILYANREFTEFTGVAESDLRTGHACGVFGCVNALTDPRGCGFGPDCTDCSLRIAIEDTWETGCSRRNIERRLTLERDGIRREVVLLGATSLMQATGQPRLLLCLQDITERKRGEEALWALSRRQLKIQEEERRLLARELHDEIGQLLTGLKLTLEMATGRGTDSGQEALRESLDLVGELIRQVRELSLTLRPPILDDLGLLPALLWQFERYTARTQIRVDFEHTGLGGRPCPPDVETATYRIVQEALTNIVRHAEASAVLVRIRIDQGRLALQVEDHGRGFEPTIVLMPGASSGLAGMHERARLLGGRLWIESSPGAGTRILADLPLG